MNKKVSVIETLIETALWKSRLIVILPVIFGIIAAAALFVTASIEIYQAVKYMHLFSEQPSGEHTALIIHIITAIDQYLIGIVLLIFAFGIYELFISKIDAARQAEGDSILDIGSLDELKNKILKVVVMVLIVSLSKSLLTATVGSVLDLLFLSLAILALSGCVFLVRNIEGDKK